MSAPAPAPASNATASGAAQAPKTIIRKRRPVNPLVQKKKPPPRPTAPANGARPQALRPVQPAPPEEEYEDYPIVVTTRVPGRSPGDGIRHHALRFLPNLSADSQRISLLDDRQFQRPVRLHRRDPRANSWTQMSAEAEAASAADRQADDKERERLEAIRAERRAEREALAAQTAPVARKEPPVKKNRFGRKLDQSRTFSDAAEKKKNMAIRYEEALPWHIEDFEDKNVWRGTYEGALSGNHVILTRYGNGFQMVPLEKWYKFTPKNKFKALSFEEAEEAMKKGAKDPLMLRRAMDENRNKKTEEAQRTTKLFTRKGERGERPMRIKREDDGDDEAPEEAADIDDIDFNYDEDFADDEEGPELVGAEERELAKETDAKIKAEMREAPVFELRDDKDHDAEEEEQKRKAAQERKHRKRVEKQLARRELNYQYEEDSNSDPYASDGDSEDSEIERQKAEEAKKEEERKAGDSKGKASEKTVLGAPMKGSSTPLGSSKPSKSVDPLRKLKRPGSPSMSEASGNESSSRNKKLKKKHLGSSGLGDAAKLSRPGSPSGSKSPTLAAPQPQRPGKAGRIGEGGAGSGSEVELSDGSRMRGGRKRGPPTGSPASSRPGSPGAAGAAGKKKQKTQEPLPESLGPLLLSFIPAEGTSIAKIIQQDEVKPFTKHPEFMTLMKSCLRMENGKVFRKTQEGPSGNGTPSHAG